MSRRWWRWWWWWCMWWSCAGALQCAQRREISPCTCHYAMVGREHDGPVAVVCERLARYADAANALTDRFPPLTVAHLAIAHSNVDDMPAHLAFATLGFDLKYLKLNHDNITSLSDAAFVGLHSTEYLSFADNELASMPRHVLRHMPGVRTLDIGRNKLKVLTAIDLKMLPNLNFLMLAGNGMASVERNALPRALRQLNIGENQLSSLNGTLRQLDNLEFLLVHSNRLTTIDGEIPTNAYNMTMINAADNRLESLPRELRTMPAIDTLYFYHNNIKSLNGVLKNLGKLEMINLSFNKIKYIAHDDFAEDVSLANLDLSHNQIVALNGSLRNLSLLRYLNLTHNELADFSLQEIRGVRRLLVVDLSYNKITHLSGNTENMVDLQTTVLELRLSYNRLKSLGGALMGLHGLYKLNVSHNLLDIISPDDLIGLDELRVLDVSHNHITTIEETSKTFLPNLEELHAAFNKVTYLINDFHGLPKLCHADLSHNNVESMSLELVTKTKCSIHGVPGTLKMYLHDNPVLCDEHFPELNRYLSELNARAYGECTRHKAPLLAFTPTVVTTSLLNDIMPIAPRQHHLVHHAPSSTQNYWH